MGAHSQASKIQGREPVRMHPEDAQARGISAGDIVRIFNERGSCLAGVVLTEGILPGVIQLSTGAWYDPIDRSESNALEVHGNPNVLTEDIGTSKLAQGCSGQLSWVQIESWTAPLPPIHAFEQPDFAERR
jgi:biotin/methionine sulfoxide reductase